MGYGCAEHAPALAWYTHLVLDLEHFTVFIPIFPLFLLLRLDESYSHY
jgi:hypothetical protein